MRGINRVVIAGNLGADPAVKNFSNGGKVVNLSIATQEIWFDKNSGEKRKSVEWHRVSLYDALGEAAERFLKKGSAVYIEGKLKTRKYKDNDGNDKYMTEIRGHDLQMLGDGKKQNHEVQDQGDPDSDIGNSQAVDASIEEDPVDNDSKKTYLENTKEVSEETVKEDHEDINKEDESDDDVDADDILNDF